MTKQNFTLNSICYSKVNWKASNNQIKLPLNGLWKLKHGNIFYTSYNYCIIKLLHRHACRTLEEQMVWLEQQWIKSASNHCTFYHETLILDCVSLESNITLKKRTTKIENSPLKSVRNVGPKFDHNCRKLY